MILFISDIKTQKRHIEKNAFVYLSVSLFCALFGMIYEQYSHGVYSAYMIYAFLFPLAGAALPFSALVFFSCNRLPGRLPLNLYNSGIAALTVGSLMEGVLEIYGTTSDLLLIYPIIGYSFAVLGLLLYIIGLFATKIEGNNENEN